MRMGTFLQKRKNFTNSLILLVLDCSLSSSQSCNRNTERRAGNIVQTDFVAEFNGGRVTAVFAADTAVELAVYRLAQFDCHLHQLANASLIQLSERIAFEDLSVVVSTEELTSIVTREAVSRLYRSRRNQLP